MQLLCRITLLYCQKMAKFGTTCQNMNFSSSLYIYFKYMFFCFFFWINKLQFLRNSQLIVEIWTFLVAIIFLNAQFFWANMLFFAINFPNINFFGGQYFLIVQCFYLNMLYSAKTAKFAKNCRNMWLLFINARFLFFFTNMLILPKIGKIRD